MLVLMAFTGTWFGFANPWLHLPGVIFLLPLALILGTQQASTARQALTHGLLMAWPGYSASLYWLAIPVHDFGGFPWILALPCPILVGAVLAAYAGLFCLGLFYVQSTNKTLWAVIFSGVFWATLELGRNYLFTGFPWLSLASAWGPWPWALGLAAWIGSFGLAGLMVAMTYLALLRNKYAWLSLAIVTLILLGPYWWSSAPSIKATASITLVQGNIDQDQKWDAAMQNRTIAQYAHLSHQSLAEHPTDLLVWPETALPFYYQEPSALSLAVQTLTKELQTPILVGAPAYSKTQGSAPAPFVLHNRAYLLGAQGQTLSWYDKEHLVPFGEYVPGGRWFPFLTKLVPGEYEFRSSTHTTPLQLQDMAMGVLICYEAIFPELAQARVAQGANILVNISNDAWFGRSSAPQQHLYLAVLRAVEQNRALVRGTNTGISTFIAPHGALGTRGDMFVPTTITEHQIPLLTETSFFHDHFYWIHMTWPILSILFLAAARRIKTQQNP